MGLVVLDPGQVEKTFTPDPWIFEVMLKNLYRSQNEVITETINEFQMMLSRKDAPTDLNTKGAVICSWKI
jgi:hypothetical protein